MGLTLISSLYFSSSITFDNRLYGTIGVVFDLVTWFIGIGIVIVLGAACGVVWQEPRTGVGRPRNPCCHATARNVRRGRPTAGQRDVEAALRRTRAHKPRVPAGRQSALLLPVFQLYEDEGVSADLLLRRTTPTLLA